MKLEKSFYQRPCLEVAKDLVGKVLVLDKRVGIGYASQADQDRLWRFKMGDKCRHFE